MNKKIKVLKIVDQNTLVVNVGNEDGISEQYEFLVYALGEELFDPDTSESLGKLEIVKGIGKPIHIQDKITTIQSNSFEHSEKRKIIKRHNNNSFISIINGTSSEEIIEPTESRIIPFENPLVGDSVKIIKI